MHVRRPAVVARFPKIGLPDKPADVDVRAVDVKTVTRIAINLHILDVRYAAINQDAICRTSEGIDQRIAGVVASCGVLYRLSPADLFNVFD